MQVHVYDAVIKGVLVGLFMAISVGPTLFAVIKYSLHFSYKAGLAFVLGVSASDFMYVALANIAAPWLELLRPYEKYIGYGGGVFLMAAGLSALFKKQVVKEAADSAPLISGGHYFRIGLSGFLINTLNPGALVTWLGAVTLIATAPPLYRFFLFGTALIIILSVDFSKVFLAERLKRVLTSKRIVYVQRFSGLCLLVIGLMLVITTAASSGGHKNGEQNRIDKILAPSK
jgi:threonine/homoserine/homoserine lactone efflux protein